MFRKSYTQKSIAFVSCSVVCLYASIASSQQSTITPADNSMVLGANASDTSGQAPFASSIRKVEQSSDTLLFRDFRVDMNEVFKLVGAGASPALVIVYADTVTFPLGTRFDATGLNILLFARKIVSDDSAQLTFDFGKSPDGSLSIFVGDPDSRLTVEAKTEAQTTPVSLSGQPGKSFQYNLLGYSGKQVWAKSFDEAPYQLFINNPDLRELLSGSIDFAVAVSESAPQEADSILDWVHACSQQGVANDDEGAEEWADVAALSSSFDLYLKNVSSGAHFVPALSPDLYSHLAQRYIQVAKDYYDEVQRFQDSRTSLQDKEKSAQLMIEHLRDGEAAQSTIIEQAQKNLDDATEAKDSGVALINRQLAELEWSRIAFQMGVRQWEHDQRVMAAVNILESAFTLGFGIATLGAGVPTGGASAANGAASLAISAPHLATQCKYLADTARGFEAIIKASKAINEANRSMTSSKQIAEKLGQLKEQTNLSQGLTTSAAWDAYREVVQAQLKTAIDKNISGAANFQRDFLILIVYQKSLAESYTAISKYTQELATLIVQRNVTQKQIARMQESIKDMRTDAGKINELSRRFYDRYVDMTKYVYFALRNYVDAFEYWSLSDYPIRPSLNKTVFQLESDVARIGYDYVNYLQTLPRVPQPFHGVTVEYSAPALLDALRTRRTVVLPILQNQREFQGLDRVRLSTIRVWLDGATSSLPGQYVYARIKDAGIFEDRLNDKTFLFSSKPQERVFVYLANRGPDGIILDGSIWDEMKFDFVHPTPFTQWQISLPEEFNKGLDLAGLTKIRLEFDGNTMGH